MPEVMVVIGGYVDILAPLLTLTIAAAALLFAREQLNASRAQQREATAYSIYSDQLKLDLQFPEFSAPDLEEIKRAGRLNQYDDYVSHLLFACENILNITKDEAWRWAVKNYLAEHVSYVKAYYMSADAPYFKEFQTGYSKELIALLKEVLTKAD